MALTSFYAGAALVGVLFPLWIMMACDSNPRLVYQRGEEGRGRGTWVGRVLRHAGLMCLPLATPTLSRLVAWPAMRVQGVCARCWCFALRSMFLSATAPPAHTPCSQCWAKVAQQAVLPCPGPPCRRCQCSAAPAGSPTSCWAMHRSYPGLCGCLACRAAGRRGRRRQRSATPAAWTHDSEWVCPVLRRLRCVTSIQAQGALKLTGRQRQQCWVWRGGAPLGGAGPSVQLPRLLSPSVLLLGAAWRHAERSSFECPTIVAAARGLRSRRAPDQSP